MPSTKRWKRACVIIGSPCRRLPHAARCRALPPSRASRADAPLSAGSERRLHRKRWVMAAMLAAGCGKVIGIGDLHLAPDGGEASDSMPDAATSDCPAAPPHTVIACATVVFDR